MVPDAPGSADATASYTARVTDEPIDPARVMAQVGSAGDGAVLLFLGTVRNHAEGRAVTGLRYEAYLPMAREVLEQLAREAAGRLGSGGVAAVHRVGALDVGEVSVALAVSSSHRAEAFEVAKIFMDDLKVRLPVWKRERYVDGGESWVDGSAISPSSGPDSGGG